MVILFALLFTWPSKYLPISQVYIAYNNMCATLSIGNPEFQEIDGISELGINDNIAIVIVQNITKTSFLPNFHRTFNDKMQTRSKMVGLPKIIFLSNQSLVGISTK